MDSYYQDYQSKEMDEGLRFKCQNASTWLSNADYSPNARNFQQKTYPPSRLWSDRSQGDPYVTCNPCPTEFSSANRKKEHNTFETIVLQRLDALQAQLDKMALENEEVGIRLRSNLQTDVVMMGTVLRTRFEEEFRSYEERIVTRLEEYSSKIAQMYETLLHRKIKDLQHDLQAIQCWMIRVEKRMENEMGQLYYGMFKAQGRFDDDDRDGVSEGHTACSPLPVDELPCYIDESISEDPRDEGVEKGCETTSPVSCAYNDNERFLCNDIAYCRSDYLAKETVHMADMEEWSYAAWSPVEERDHSRGDDLPPQPEGSSRSPRIRTCYSCEIACAPQVQACFGAVALSTSRENSHEEASWDKEGSMATSEDQQRKCKKERRVGAQVWIPKGTLEVMRIFLMTELSLGETSSAPYRAKRRRRRKSSHPLEGVG